MHWLFYCDAAENAGSQEKMTRMGQVGFSLLHTFSIACSYCKTYYNKFRKNSSCTHLLFHIFHGSEVWTWVQWVLGSGFHQATIKVSSGLGFHPRLGGLMLSSLVLAEFFPHDCLAEIPFFLLAIDWGPDGSDSKDSTSKAEDLGSIPGLGRSPGEENPLQKFCLGNPIDRGDWWATVHGVTKSWSQLSGFHFTSLSRPTVPCYIAPSLGRPMWQVTSSKPAGEGLPWWSSG